MNYRPQHNDKALFSVVTINYNNLDGLKKTMASVAAQTCQSLEYVIIDGKSSDGSEAYLREFKDRPVMAISEQDDGIYHAMNKGISRCTGQYVIFMNSGDTFLDPFTLEKVQRAIENSQALPGFIYADTLESEESGRLLTYKKAKSHRKAYYGMFAHHQSMFFNNDIIRESDIRYDETLKIAGDWGFVLRFLQAIPKDSILYLEAPVSVFELGGYSSNFVTGIKEQYGLRRQVLGWNHLKCLNMAGLHFILNVIRHRVPVVYRTYIRMRSGTYRKKQVV